MGGHGQVAPFAHTPISNAFYQPLWRITLSRVFGCNIFKGRSDKLDCNRMTSKAIVLSRQGFVGKTMASHK